MIRDLLYLACRSLFSRILDLCNSGDSEIQCRESCNYSGKNPDIVFKTLSFLYIARIRCQQIVFISMQIRKSRRAESTDGKIVRIKCWHLCIHKYANPKVEACRIHRWRNCRNQMLAFVIHKYVNPIVEACQIRHLQNPELTKSANHILGTHC